MLKYWELSREIGNKKRMATITTFIHHHTGDARQCNKGTKRDQSYKNWKGRKIIIIHIQNDYICRKSNGIYNKLLQLINYFNKVARDGGNIFLTVSSMPIYQ